MTVGSGVSNAANTRVSPAGTADAEATLPTHVGCNEPDATGRLVCRDRDGADIDV